MVAIVVVGDAGGPVDRGALPAGLGDHPRRRDCFGAVAGDDDHRARLAGGQPGRDQRDADPAGGGGDDRRRADLPVAAGDQPARRLVGGDGGGGDDDARGARPPGQRAAGADDDQQDGRRGEQPGTAAAVTASLLRTDAAQGAVQAELAGGVCVWRAVEEQLGRDRVDARRGVAELGELFPRGRALLEVVADRLLLVAVELAQTVGQQVGVVVLTGPGHVWSPSAGGFIAARRARSAW